MIPSTKFGILNDQFPWEVQIPNPNFLQETCVKTNELENILEFSQKWNLESLKESIQNTKHLWERDLHWMEPYKNKECVRETKHDLVWEAYQSREIAT